MSTKFETGENRVENYENSIEVETVRPDFEYSTNLPGFEQPGELGYEQVKPNDPASLPAKVEPTNPEVESTAKVEPARYNLPMKWIIKEVTIWTSFITATILGFTYATTGIEILRSIALLGFLVCTVTLLAQEPASKYKIDSRAGKHSETNPAR